MSAETEVANASIGAEAQTAEADVKHPLHDEPQQKFRKDYSAPPYLVDTVHLNFILNEDVTRVISTLSLKPNYPEGTPPPPLKLDGRRDVVLASVKVNSSLLAEGSDSYSRTEKALTIHSLPAGALEVEVETHLKPQDNTLLEGLYKSSGNYCTQCEAEGFRGITYFLDRPDVMAKYTTRMEADKAAYPVLLGNGNLAEEGELPDGRHYAVWVDPFPKPCYLFALVAGKLAIAERKFTTMQGKDVALRIFVQENNLIKVDHALESLIKSMKWDEETYGLEYDLELFNIVAVDDFNMGAMENKSLNIFNSRLVLASPDTATDVDYSRIEGVVAHEYFHNWTGNRVTCRDWFQLTLKEGLTVYRDQEFSADMNSRAVKRIDDVAMLRASQFSEDAGPMAHPIRPESYIKMDNFYTVTVYEKGAEVVRLYETLLGKEGFRKGMDLYFKRHDGCAVTCDDFLAAMADANGVDLATLGRWYSQAGTPHLTVACSFNEAPQTFTLHCKQRTPPSPGQDAKLPVLIPLRVGLIGPDGKDLPLRLADQEADLGTSTVLRFDTEVAQYTFTGVSTRPVPSLLRGFSAPVKMQVEGMTDDDLFFMFANDSDPFNRWEAGQRLSKQLLLKLYHAAVDSKSSANGTENGHHANGSAASLPLSEVGARCAADGGVPEGLVAAYRAILNDTALDGAFQAMAISLPSSAELLDQIPGADPVLLYNIRLWLNQQLAQQLRPELQAAVKKNDTEPGAPYRFAPDDCARRSLKNKCLALLSTLGDSSVTQDLLQRFRASTNMTDKQAALGCLVEVPGPEREAALDEFYQTFKDQPLVLLKWLGLQAMSNAPGNLTLVKQLVDHPAFTITNPNSCYSLFLGFARAPVNFHAADGSGYAFMADCVIKVNGINQQVAARLASAFTTWKQYDAPRQALMKEQLQRILAHNGLSENVYEIVTKTLA